MSPMRALAGFGLVRGHLGEGDMDDRKLHAIVLREIAEESCAQATLEYALTVIAFMAMVSGLALLWHADADGALARAVEEAASHALDGLGLLDISLY